MSTPDILPNCLTKFPRADRNFCPGGNWFYLFCGSCHKESPYRVMDTLLPAQYAFYLCNDCVETYGEPAGFAVTPDDIFREKVPELP